MLLCIYITSFYIQFESVDAGRGVVADVAGLATEPFGIDDEDDDIHVTQGHGPPNFLAKRERNFNAGPNFIPNVLVKCSSVSSGKQVPSILCSRKFCGSHIIQESRVTNIKRK